jgi:hypothetical protein
MVTSRIRTLSAVNVVSPSLSNCTASALGRIDATANDCADADLAPEATSKTTPNIIFVRIVFCSPTRKD